MSKRSRVHPNHKTKYRVTNWHDYDQALVSRGTVTLWLSPSAISGWKATATKRRGGQPKYSDLAIETTLTLRLIYRLPLRQAEGFTRSLFELMDVHLDVPDHTTLSRRSSTVKLSARLPKSNGPIDLVIDSSGLAIFGEGQWAAAKHGGKGIQGWKKLHLGVDRQGMIVAQKLTERKRDDATVGVELIGNTNGKIRSVTGDAAYDTRPFYRAGADRAARVVVPPNKRATATTRRRCPARERTIRRVEKVGRRRWKKESGYHRQARAENAFFRYKTIIGDRLRARGHRTQEKEATLACNILNRMTALGKPNSIAVAR